MPARLSPFALLILLAVTVTPMTAADAAAERKAAEQPINTPTLQDTAFWRDSAGWWVSKNTYLDGELQQKIAAYNSIVHIEVQGLQVLETTYTFYPPGDNSSYYSKGAVTTDKGIELITVMTMKAIDNGCAVETVSVNPARQAGSTITAPLSETVALQQHLDATSGLANYHTLISMPTPDRRNTAVFGIRTGLENEDVQAGDLRGFALFITQRIAASEVEPTRMRFRQMHSVGGVVNGDAQGEIVVELLD